MWSAQTSCHLSQETHNPSKSDLICIWRTRSIVFLHISALPRQREQIVLQTLLWHHPTSSSTSRHVRQKDANLNLNRKPNIQRWSEDESGTRGRIRASVEREERGGRGGVCVCVDTERHFIWISRRLKIKTQSGTTETRNQVWASLTAGFITALHT